jgi:predicted  nucleic acid-binding Zn-ribbon protein
MSQSLSLYRLQQTDSHIDRAQTRIQAIKIMLGDDVELRLAKEQADAASIRIQSGNNALKLAELAVQEQRIKIEQAEAALYSGKGQSPKELQDLQNDIASLKRHKTTLEDIQLEAMQVAEEADQIHQAAQVGLLASEKRSAENELILQEEQEKLQNDLQKLFSERAAIVGSISAGSLDLYDQLRQQHRGIAVAVISDKSCSACGSVLSPAQIQSSRFSGQIALCPSCGRILYGS